MRVLLDNPIKLYRDCMRLADYLAHKQGFPRDTMRATVRAPWRKHQNETDTEEIMRHREAAVRGLSNYMTYEASKGAMEGVPAEELVLRWRRSPLNFGSCQKGRASCQALDASVPREKAESWRRERLTTNDVGPCLAAGVTGSASRAEAATL